MTARVADWWAGGTRIAGPGGRSIFARVDGPEDAPVLTLLHGFPTSSFDWRPVVERLRGERRIVTLDFLGFGNSFKPRAHRYSLLEQADAVEAAWRQLGVERTALVGHDYGVSVGLELLAREDDDELQVAITAASFLNGGMIADLHRPLPIQRLLAHRFAGPVATRFVTERTFKRSLRRVLGRQLDDAELHEHWVALDNRRGRTHTHRLLGYLEDRRTYAHRWEEALRRARMPLQFVWGPLDPISGAHMLEELRSRRPDAEVVELDGVGHYPQLEAPDEVAEALRRLPAS